jgi:hypothetical protein
MTHLPSSTRFVPSKHHRGHTRTYSRKRGRITGRALNPELEVTMADVLASKRDYQVRRVSKSSVEYKLILSVCFLVFLLAGAIQRLSPWNWLAQEDAGPPPSLFAQAWGAACTCTAYAFMG